MIKQTILIFVFAFTSGFCFSQSQETINRLKHELAIAASDTARIQAQLSLCFEYRLINADSSLLYEYHGILAKDPRDSSNKSFNAVPIEIGIKMNLDPTLPLVNVIPQDIGRVLLNLFNNAFGAVNERSKNLTPVTVNLAGLSENTIEDQRAGRPASQGLPVDYTTNLAGSSDTKANPNLQGYQPTVTLTTKNLSDKIEIIIHDNGNGILQNILDKIFQPFFTTKPTGQGTGLGLSLAYDIVKLHGGELSSGPFGKVDTGDGIRSTFIIQLTP